MSETLNIRFPDDMLAWLRQEGARKDRAPSYLVKQYVAERMPKRSKPKTPQVVGGKVIKKAMDHAR